jgi:carbonic anhydrase/acetyltransferase-like protein (isoleucine patch superfamily)
MSVFSLGERKVVFRGDEWFIAPNATVVGSVVIENQASVWFDVVIRGDNDLVTIGERSNVQDGSVLHTDPGIRLTLGRGVSIGHKAMLHGCTVQDGALIGINSVILNNAVIGKGSLVGANSLVPEGRVIPEGVLALGSPAKVLRELKPEERAMLAAIADGYVERGRLFRTQMKPQAV